MRFSSQLVWIGCLCVIASLSLGVSYWSVRVQALDGSEAKAALASAPGCNDSYKEIRKFYDALPTDFKATSKQRANRLAEGTAKTIAECQKFMRSCPNDKNAGEVSAIYAKLLFIMVNRKTQEINARVNLLPAEKRAAARSQMFKDYIGAIRNSASIAIRALPKDHALLPETVETLALAAMYEKDFPAAVKSFQEFLERFPSHKNAGAVTRSLGRCYLEADELDAGVALLKPALKKYYTTEYYPPIIDTLRKIYLAKGDIDGFEHCVDTVMVVFPLRMKSSRRQGASRDVLERYVLYYGFHKGFAQFARGNIDGARAAFQKHVATLDALEVKLRESKRQLRPEYNIYRGRSLAHLDFLNERLGNPPAKDIDLGAFWVTDRKIQLSASRGKVVGILFRRVGEDRSRHFMQEVGEFFDQAPGGEMVTVSFLRSGDKVPEKMEQLREELFAMGYGGAAGFDPDVDEQSLIRSYGAIVGTATFMIIDKNGNLAWLLQDPKGLDATVAQTVAKRLMDS